jgi:hypothetical protein
MLLRYSVILFFVFAFCSLAQAQGSKFPRRIEGQDRLSMMDTLSNKPGESSHIHPDLADSRQTEKFYDSLESKTGRNKITNALYKLLVRRHRVDTSRLGQIVDESQELEKYAGRTIGNISISCLDVFERANSVVQKASNAVHVTTREKVIRRDLFIDPGDPIVPDEIVRNSQLLRSRHYISDLWITFHPREADTTIVDIQIVARDKWSIGLDARKIDDNRFHADLYDVNVLGSGNRLSVQTNYDWDGKDYGGNMVAYNIPNVLGTFVTANFLVGKEFEDTRLDAEISKGLYKPTDYEFGLSYMDDRVRFYELYRDDYTMISYKNWDAWLGFSKKMGKWRSSAYMIVRYMNGTFDLRPEVGPRFNPRFHGYETALLGMGLYREKFYAANMIYGFGYKEYMASGYRLDLTMGYNWGEFNDGYYAALSYRRGGYTRIGYFVGDATVGTYIDRDTGKWWQSMADVNVRWFSPLFTRGRSSLRQFVTLNYTLGWNRGEGNDEYLSFTKEQGPRSLRDYYIGRSRGGINTETVVFTPWQPMGFQIALFGYADAGFLGEHANPFQNDFYGTVGLGIRLKNERLIFKTIQFRLGLAFGKHGLIDNRWWQMSTEQRIQQYRFIPTRPEVLEMLTVGSVKKRTDEEEQRAIYVE